MNTWLPAISLHATSLCDHRKSPVQSPITQVKGVETRVWKKGSRGYRKATIRSRKTDWARDDMQLTSKPIPPWTRAPSLLPGCRLGCNSRKRPRLSNVRTGPVLTLLLKSLPGAMQSHAFCKITRYYTI